MKRKMWWYKRASWPHIVSRWLMLFSVTGYVFLPTAPVWANPTGEAVVGGAATFDRQGSTLTVNQTTDRLAVNWQDFSIAAGERTHFNMPSSTSVALNRVLGGNPSQIYGTLSASGILYLVNPSGIFVGPSGVVNAASFVGSTLDIDPTQFMHAGQDGFQLHGNSYAPIVNQGNIKAEKGDVFLIAQKVENRGAITAPNGKAALVGTGEKTEVVLHEVGGSGFAVRVTQLQGAEALGSNHNLPDGEELLNEGEIAAAQAELNASGNIYALAIKNTGTIRAKAVVAQADGTVRLDGGAGDVLNAGSLIAQNAGDISTAAGGKIEVTGQNVTASSESIITAAGGVLAGNGGHVKIDALDTAIVQGQVKVSAPAAGATGGKVELVGERVGLFDGAKVDASGGAGGGKVLVGGDYLGGQTPKPELKDLAKLEAEPVKNSKATVMAKTAEIRADATANGDGGKIILWSDEYTGFYGQLFAQGGMGGGDGGFIETSSKENLQAFGSVNTGASLGRGGHWLLDPTDVSITSAGLNTGGSFSGGDFVFDPPDTSTASISVNQLVATLGTSDVTISTSSTGSGFGQLSVSASVVYSGAHDLYLIADDDITINNNISITGGGSLFIRGDSQFSDITINAALTSNDLQITAAKLSLGTTLASGNITITTASTFSQSGTLTVGGDFRLTNTTSGKTTFGSGINAIGDVTIQVPDDFILSGGQLQGASIYLKNSGGKISLAGDVSAFSGTVNIEATQALDLAAGQIISSVDDILLRGGTGLNLAGAVQGAADKFISLDGGSGSITRTAGQGSSASSITLGSGGIAMNAGGGIDASMDVASLGTGSVTAYGGFGDVNLDIFNSVSNVDVNAQSTGGNISVTSDGDLTVVSRNNKSFSAGKDITLTVNGSGNIVLGNNNIVAAGKLEVNRGTGTIFFGLDDAGRVAGYEVDAPTQNYNGPVVINADTQLRGDSALLFSRSTTVNAPLTIDSNGSVSFSATDFVTLAGNATAGLIGDITFNGNTAVTFNANVVGSPVFGRPGGLSFQDSDNDTGVVRLNAFAGTLANPIGFFAKEGGTVEFAAGGGLTTPAINLISGGRLVLLGTKLSLASDTYLATQLDLSLSGTIDSFNDNNAIGFRVVTPGQFILNGIGAGLAFPLRTFWVDTSSGTGDILVNAPIEVRSMDKDPATNLPYTANNGTIELYAGGSDVINGNLASNIYSTLEGNITIRAGMGVGHKVTDNIQIGAVTIQTRGGSLTFGSAAGNPDGTSDGNVFFVAGTPTLDTFADNAAGDMAFYGDLDGNNNQVNFNAGTGSIVFHQSLGQLSPFDINIQTAAAVEFAKSVVLGTATSTVGTAFIGTEQVPGNIVFNGTLDKLAGTLQMALGKSTVSFEETVGANKPFGLTVTSSSGINFAQAVVMGGSFALTASDNGLGDGIVFNGTLDGAQTLTLNGATSKVQFQGNVGSNIPLGAITVAAGDGIISIGGDISTSGGAISLNKAVTLTGDSTISTIALNSTTGANITFAKAVEGGFDFTLNAGSLGALQFGDGGSTFSRLTVLGAGGGFGVNGTLKANGIIDIFPAVNPVVNGQKIAIESMYFLDPLNPSLHAIQLRAGILGQSGSTAGSDVTLTANNGDVVVGGNITLTGASLVANAPGYDGGNLTINAKSVELKGITSLGGSDNEPLSPGSGNGGTIRITATEGGISIGTITTTGGLQGVKGTGGKGGDVYLDAAGQIFVSAIDTSGGRTSDGLGGNAGNITFLSKSDLLIPASLVAIGGQGATDTGTNPNFYGKSGLVTMQTTGTGNDVAFATASLDLLADMNLRVRSAGNIILGVVSDFTNPTQPVSGTILTMNSETTQDATGSAVSDLARRGNVIFEFGMEDRDASFYAPSSAVIVSNGGDVYVNRLNANAPLTLANGTVRLDGGIYTSAPGLDGGRVMINVTEAFEASLGGTSSVVSPAAVRVEGSINTAGGAPDNPKYGRNGGAVVLNGTTVSFLQINSGGSASLSTATSPAFGGAGGNVTLNGDTIVILGGTNPTEGYLAIDASGGAGLGTGNANGGGGGSIVFNGNVVLDSGDSDRTTVILSSQAGTSSGNGLTPRGGDITIRGNLTGTKVSSNILDLRYGSGTATLGETGDTITLETLITAADNTRSRGSLVINGSLDVGSLTTYARGYSIAINGGGSIANAANFKNTGMLMLGNSSISTTFKGGLDASLVSGALLKGLIVSGDSLLPGSATPMTFGVAQLVGNTALNSNGSNVSLGQVDGAYDLLFASGIGAGVVDISLAVGANTRLNQITVSQGISQPVIFRDSVFANDMLGQVGTAITFLGSVNLTGGAQFQGLTTLDNSLYESQNTIFDFLANGDSNLNQIVLASGPIRLTGSGNYSINGAVTGAENFKLDGLGTKLFLSAIGSTTERVGDGNTGIEQANNSGAVTFQGNVFTSGVSTFGADVTLAGMTYDSNERVDFGGDVFDSVTLDANTVTLAGTGNKVFNGTVSSFVGLEQGATSGKVTFVNDVTSVGTAGTFTLAGDVEFAGLVFSSGGAVTLTKTVLLSEGPVTLTGNGNYTVSASVNGAQNLALNGSGIKSFTGAMGGVTGIGTGVGAAVSISGGDVSFGVINTASGISSTANLVFNRDVQIAGTGDTGSSFLGTVQLAGISFTSGLGTLFGDTVTLSGGATTFGGDTGGDYQLFGKLLGTSSGSQSLIYSSAGDIAFLNDVGSSGLRFAGLSQGNSAGGMQFQGNVFTAGNSSFGGNVILNGANFDADGTTSYNTVQLSGVGVTLKGAGDHSISGLLTGNGVGLTLDGSGGKLFSTMQDLSTLKQEASSGLVTLGGDVTTTGSIEMNATTRISGPVGVDSGSSKQSYTTTVLAGNLSTTTTFNVPGTDAVSFGAGGVSGTGNLTILGVSSIGIGNTVANVGTFGLNRNGVIILGSGGILTAPEMALIRSTGGAIFTATGVAGSINADDLTANTALTLNADQAVTATGVSGSAMSLRAGTTATATSVNGNSLELQAGSGLASANDVSLSGALSLSSVANGLSLGGSSTAAIVNLDGTEVSGISALAVPRIGAVTLTAGGLDYRPSGNLATTGKIKTSGDVVLAPSGNFVNEFSGNPFSSPSTRLLTRDFFTYPQNAGVPGFSTVLANSIDQVGPNQIGVTLPLLAGSGGPYISEFTTGTGQPYILATQNAVAPVMTPVAYTVAGAYPAKVSYSQEEIEMMTPEERSAYQAAQRRQSARVILQRDSGQQEEIGVPVDGGTPQAKSGEGKGQTPTAQAQNSNKPMASKSSKEKEDTTQVLKNRAAKAVALRPGFDSQSVMENERLAAEVNLEAAPVATR